MATPYKLSDLTQLKRFKHGGSWKCVKGIYDMRDRSKIGTKTIVTHLILPYDNNDVISEAHSYLFQDNLPLVLNPVTKFGTDKPYGSSLFVDVPELFIDFIENYVVSNPKIFGLEKSETIRRINSRESHGNLIRICKTNRDNARYSTLSDDKPLRITPSNDQYQLVIEVVKSDLGTDIVREIEPLIRKTTMDFNTLLFKKDLENQDLITLDT